MTGTSTTLTRSIDARGMPCPGPLMSLIGAIRQGAVGDGHEGARTPDA